MLRIGDRVPPAAFVNTSGEMIQLTSLLDGACHLLLVFLRHLG